MKNVIIKGVYAVGMHDWGGSLEIDQVMYASAQENNPYDRHAVAVYDDSEKTRVRGYFRRNDAKNIHKILKEGHPCGHIYVKAKDVPTKFNKFSGPMQKYMPREKRNKWSQEAMSAALHEVKHGLLTIRKAAAKYGVPRSTLADRVSGNVDENAHNGKNPLLSKADETHLVELANKRAQMGIGFTKSNFKRAAAALAKKRGMPFKGVGPSEKWWTLFRKRNGGLSLRQPETTAGVRQKLMRRDRVASYFSVLKDTEDELHLSDSPSNIWNMDETCINLSSDSAKVVARKGLKYIQCKSGNRETVTMIACGNAAGYMMPPHFIVKGKTKLALRSWDTDRAPAGSFISVSDSGWTKQGLSSLWFTEVFLKHIGPHRPQMLIFDGHDSHHHIELVELARDNNITLMEMPSHCSHWLQPLDRTVFGPFKKYWKESITTFLAETGCPVTHANFFRLVSQAWAKLSPDYLVNGFRATGIYPWDSSVIPLEAFLPSTLYSESSTACNETTRPLSIAVDDIPNIHDIEITEGSTVMDLGMIIDSNGVVSPNPNPIATASDPLPIAATSDSCPPELALAALECSLDSASRRKYEAAFSLGKDIPGDNRFQTWITYKKRMLSPSLAEEPIDILKIPTLPQQTAKKTTSKPGYFVISCDEAFENKKQTEFQKLLKSQEKKVKANKVKINKKK